MAQASNALFRALYRIRHSIAFYPTVIAAAYLVASGLVIAFEATPLASRLRDDLPSGLTDADNAREILGTLITSIVSLMVFSFSMVMVVLNGAATRLSPRVLPGLISDLRNRVILGVYLGSILYYLSQIILINKNDPQSIPTLGMLLAVLFAAVCLILFVVFIRSVSQSIQVDWNVNRLHQEALKQLEARKKRLRQAPPVPDDSQWPCLVAQRPGYLRNVNEKRLGELLGKRDRVATLQVEPGFFLIEGHPLIKLSGELSEREAQEVQDCMDFSNDEYASSNAAYGMRQMSEIAVKAISPAVNDPGTAIRTLNLIGVLLGRMMGVPPYDVGCFDNGKPRLFYRQLPIHRVLTAVTSPIRNYGRGDPQVIIALLQCLESAIRFDPSPDQLDALWEEAHAVRDEADDCVNNCRDRSAINDLIERLNALDLPTPRLRPLPPHPGD
ncbi:DUF2254 domain-containing protein [Stutzerimonas nosocomialis]|uniref:DUF2254 domain-containing protein n=1 Tax=Stutzerimonas nosocomialis TaxID=1056496 RepID=UPI001107D312|nr:DUF2254 domain-containing protein [Stutzerimonas nosocomialis]TLX59474.1 DUF2254 domain-containing protein [Stutzerimonas nosocomialis]